MAKSQTQVTFSSAASVSIASGGNATSDAFTFGSTSTAATLQVKADNNGTPASGDTVDVYILYTNGDPDAAPDSADEYDTVGHAQPICTLDTTVEDPAIETVEINAMAKGAKIYFKNNSGGRAITCSAQFTEGP
jgi:isopentenyl diphosphate isomerase/L-lactate dehydrogenase-like FMN-dependent dehydrogenase